jgi:hypothetical protein
VKLAHPVRDPGQTIRSLGEAPIGNRGAIFRNIGSHLRVSHASIRVIDCTVDETDWDRVSAGAAVVGQFQP